MVGGGSNKSDSKSESKTFAQKLLLKKAIRAYAPEIGQNENVWQGQRVAPLTDLQQQSITGAGNFASYFSTPQQAGTPLFQETGEAARGLLAGETGAKKMGQPEIEQYFTETLYNPTMRNLREDTLPLIDESYAGPGFFGSARSHGRQEAIENTRDTLGQQWAGLNWDVTRRNQELDEAKAGRSLATLGPAMQYGQVPAQEIQNNLQIAASQIGGLNDIFGIGSAEQTQEQRELQAEIMKFAEENSITDQENLSIILALLGQNFSSSSSSSSGWNVSIGAGQK